MTKADAVYMVKGWKYLDPDVVEGLIMAIGSKEIPNDDKAIAMVIGTFIKGQLELCRKTFDFAMICNCCRSGRELFANLNQLSVPPDCRTDCEYYVYGQGY